ncbi:MAG: phosphoglucosamine mutase [Opitutaceae bacterium]|nr:phosphoglucosamine mutase [Opitutaceae bacterium]
MKRIYFGTDGVRGPYGGPVINEAFATRLGLAAGRWVGGEGTAFIGRDTRASGASLVEAMARGLRACGLHVVSLGVLPTPAVARRVRDHGAVLGVMITASHNPAGDNGIKFFARKGVKLSDEDEALIEEHLPPEGRTVGGNGPLPTGDGTADYIRDVTAMLPPGALAGWRIALDTANGSTVATSPAVLRSLGAEIVGVGDSPDGLNINAGVGSEHPGALMQAVKSSGARLGIAHDGDGDRCVLCDETGSLLDGDELLTILATHALSKGALPNSEMVITVQSNLGVDAAVRAAGGKVARTSVGDRYVVERMVADGSLLGGESSGHVVCADVSPSGDGLVAAMRVLAVMRDTGRPLSELRKVLKKFPQGTRNLVVAEKRPLESCPTLAAAISEMEKELGDRGRVLVRYSGTEPKLRFLVEASDDSEVGRGLDRLEAAARQDLGATQPVAETH